MTPAHVLLPLLGLATLVAYAWLRVGGKRARGSAPSGATWAWALVPALFLIALAGTSAAGLVDTGNDILPYVVIVVITCACGVLTLSRKAIWKRYEALSNRWRLVVRIVLILTIVGFTFLSIEVPFNECLPTLEGPTYYWLEMLLCGLLLGVLYYLGQRHGSLCIVGVAFFCFVGIAQYFLKRFKNCAILPTDLLVLGTAAAVSKEYVYILSLDALRGLLCAVVAICLLSLVRPPVSAPTKRTVAVNLGRGAAFVGVLAICVLAPNYMSLLGLKMEYWFSMSYYQQQGFFPTFIAVWQDLPIKKPEGYDSQEATELLQHYADEYRASTKSDTSQQAAQRQFEEIQPSVVVIMNESFADLSVFDDLHAGYTGPEFLTNGLPDALARGTLNVSVYGGSTCNSEFEFLTSNSLNFAGAGKYPYSMYDLSKVNALAQTFDELGYHTCAMHPNYATNWNRDRVYPALGFSDTKFIEAFGGMPSTPSLVTPNEPHCELFHSGVADSETYERVLELLREDDTPQFIFDVTMANHGSYDQHNIPLIYRTNYNPTDYEGEDAPERLNEYLACVNRSDDDLKAFEEELRKLDRPVVLVFFGDHQPNITMSFNDAWYPDEDAGTHARRIFSTDYVIWANYDVASHKNDKDGAINDELSVDLLAPKLLDIIGAPLTDYQAARLQLRKSIPSLSASGYKLADGTWRSTDTAMEDDQAYHDLAFISYLNFGEKVK